MTNLIKLFFGKVLLGSVFLLSTNIQLASAAEFSEDQVKAVYLINFAEFIRWPDSAFSESPDTFTFCAMHTDTPVIITLKRVILNESAKGRKLIFKQISNQQEIKYCQVFYFNSSDQAHFAKFLPLLKQKNILTVSDVKAFAEQDGIITITRTRRQLRPTINVKNLEKAGLTASAKLLRLATLIKK